MKTLADQITDWLAAQADQAGARGAVLGLSGGVDSAVTAALCIRAFGDRVLGLILPCESNRSDEEDARAVAVCLGLATATVSLDAVYKALNDALQTAPGLARLNVKPRLRMAALYYYANALNYMVAGTGNRTELMVGYFTKFGDGGVDLLPIGGLYKQQVRKLARELGVPSRIIDKPPSAGLWDGQTDERELGISYAVLDAALEALASGHPTRVDTAVLANVQSMINRSAHKRAGAPVFEVST